MKRKRKGRKMKHHIKMIECYTKDILSFVSVKRLSQNGQGGVDNVIVTQTAKILRCDRR
jgi:hypothetical protein